MDEIGSILRDAREMKGLTVAEVQDEIRINADYLQALEEGQYHLLPTPVHVRGFLRNYARFLELDPEPLLERYEVAVPHAPVDGAAGTSSGQPSVSPDEPIRPRPEQPFFEPVNMNLNGDAGDSESAVRWVVIAALIVAIALAASRFVPLLMGNGDGRDNLPQMIEAIMSGEESTEEQATPAATDSNLPEVTSEPIVPSERNNPAGASTDEAAAPPTGQPLPATMEEVALRLDITERTWVQVTIDGEVVLEDQVTRDDGPFEWLAQEEAHLLTGNAAGVFVSINDIEIGKLGGRGEVADQTWTTTTAGN